MPSELIRQLKSLKNASVKPEKSWVAKNRAILLSQIKNTVPEKVSVPFGDKVVSAMSIFMPQSIALGVVRPIAVLLIAAMVAPSLYYGTVFASEGSLPGEGLYEAKRYTEKIQVTVVGLIGDSNAETQLHVQLAKRRAEETSKIVSDPVKIAAVASTVADLKNEINTINNKLEETRNDSKISANVAIDVKQNTEQITNVLQEAKNTLLVGSDDQSKALIEEVKNTKDLVQDVGMKAVEVAVAKHLEGDTTVTSDTVKQVIASTLQTSVNSVNESKESIEGFKNILVTTKDEVKDLSKDMNPQAASTTNAVSEKIGAVIDQTQVAANQTAVATEQVSVKAGEAQQLLDSNNLSAAVNAIKQINEVSKEAEKLSDSTVQNTTSFLPIVQVIRETAASSSTIDVAAVSSTVSSTLSAISSTIKMITTTLNVTGTLFVSTSSMSSSSSGPVSTTRSGTTTN